MRHSVRIDDAPIKKNASDSIPKVVSTFRADARAFFGEVDPVHRQKNAAGQRRELIPRKGKQL
jgi:hypothetical protein